MIITKSYSFNDLFIYSEQAHLARLACFTYRAGSAHA